MSDAPKKRGGPRPNSGGKRPGAGRPGRPGNWRMLTYRLPSDLLERVAAEAAKAGRSPGDEHAAALRRAYGIG